MQNIPIELIDRGSRPRKINPSAIAALKDSLTQTGQISPIVVIPDQIMRGILRDGYRLIVGHHRLSAAIELGWTAIKAVVLPAGFNQVHLELMEVDENLCRAELSAAEKAAALKKRKILWESLKEQNIQVGTKFPPDSVGYKKPPEQEKGFATSTAAVTGMSKRAINQYIKVADALGDDLDLVQSTPFDTKRGLARLSAMPREDRLQVLQESATMTDIQSATTEDHSRTPAPLSASDLSNNHSIHRQVAALVKRFFRLEPEVQRAFYETLRLTYQTKST